MSGGGQSIYLSQNHWVVEYDAGLCAYMHVLLSLSTGLGVMVVRESMATKRTLGVHGFEKGYNVFSDGRINQAP